LQMVFPWWCHPTCLIAGCCYSESDISLYAETDRFCPELLCGNFLKKYSYVLGGFAPATGASPVAIVTNYLCTKKQKICIQVMTGDHMRPRPQRGQGWRKGGDPVSRMGFFRSESGDRMEILRLPYPYRLWLSSRDFWNSDISQPRYSRMMT